MRRAVLPISVLCLLLLTACPQNQTPQQCLTEVANGIEAISIAANGAVPIVLNLMPNNTPERQQILGIIAKVVVADQHAATVVKSLDGKTITIGQIGAIATPILAEMRGAISDGLLGIKDPASQATAQNVVNSIGTAIDALQATLALYGVK